MQAFFHRLRPPLQRAACFAGAFVASATVLLAVAAAFDSTSSAPVLRDTPAARLAVARCDALADRAQRHVCVRRLVAEAVARDRGEARLAALVAPAASTRR